MFTLWVPGRLPGLNEMLAGNRASGRWNSYNEVKCVWFGQIKLLVMARGLTQQPPGCASMLFCEPTKRRDPDNLVGGGAKILFDSLVGCDVLQNDDWNNNLGMIGYWHHTPGRAGCLFHWGDELLSKPEMLRLLELEEERNGKKLTGPGTTDHPTGAQAYQQAARRRGAKPRRQLSQR